jgi:TolB-like protein
MSSDPEQDYFSDGITEEILNALAQLRNLKVAGRTSSFHFKGKNPDLRKVGDKLKVKTILEGSVRRSGNKLRITAQLINVEDGFHIWSEKYDRNMDDIFAIQDCWKKKRLRYGETLPQIPKHTTFI